MPRTRRMGSTPKRPAKLCCELHNRRRVGSSSEAKRRRGLEDLVGPLEFRIFPPPAQLLRLTGCRPVVPLTAVGLVLANPVAQRFGVHPELLSPADHRLRSD